MPRRLPRLTAVVAALLICCVAVPANAATTGPPPLDDPLAGITPDSYRLLPADAEVQRPAAVYSILDHREIVFPVAGQRAPDSPKLRFDLMTAVPLSTPESIVKGQTALLRCSQLTRSQHWGDPLSKTDWRGLCDSARANELHWSDGRTVGRPIWYARDLDGSLVCISATGRECLPSEPGIDPAAGRNRPLIRAARCDDQTDDSPLQPACALLRAALDDHGDQKAQASYDRQHARMERLFALGLNHATATAEEALNERIRILQTRIVDAESYRKSICHTSGKGRDACDAAIRDCDTLDAEMSALRGERYARIVEAQVALRAKMAEDWHELHRTWAADDPTGFAALLRVESKELSEMKTVIDEYARTAANQEQAFQDLQEQWRRDHSAIATAEKIPLLGPLIQHIEDYETNRTAVNLRRIFLGSLGPLGEVIEGSLELSADTSLKTGEQRFLSDALHEIGGKDDFGTVLESVVSDFTRDLGDEAVEGVRESGLWSPNPAPDAPPRSNYADFAHLLATAEAMPANEFVQWYSNLDLQLSNLGLRQQYGPGSAEAKRFAVDGTSSVDLHRAASEVPFERGVEAIFTHAFGADYEAVARKNPKWANADKRRITAEILKVLQDAAYTEQIRPRWVHSDTLGDRPAGFVYNDDQGVILLNLDKEFDSSTWDFAKFYLEELGHAVNWWRCEIFDVAVKHCMGQGDVGARFRDAFMLDVTASHPDFRAAVEDLPHHEEDGAMALLFADGTSAHLEGWNSYSTLNSHIAGNGRFSFLLRAGIEVATEYPGVSDEFDLEMAVGAPSMTRLGNPWVTSTKGQCATYQFGKKDDCNVPTMSIAVSFRDSVNYSVLGAPKVKNTAFAKAGVNLAPAIVRKHGVRLYFQPKPGEPESWKFMPDHSIYFKEFTLTGDGKVDGTKMVDSIADKRLPAPHRLDVAAKSNIEGSYVVEIATREKSVLDLWLALDVSSALIGCAGGFIFAVVAEQDPVLGCHTGSVLTEAVETAAQAMDKRITSFITSDASVAVPLSVEYKATRPAGRITPLPEDPVPPQPSAVEIWEVGPPPAAAAVSAQQVSSLRTKTSAALQKIKSVSFTGLAIFRPRIGWDIATRMLNLGTHSLPSANIIE